MWIVVSERNAQEMAIASIAGSHAADKQPRRRSALVVEDDSDIRELVSDFLTLEGFDVLSVSNGAAALRALEANSPSVILLDMRLPVMDGWEFAREVRARKLSVPIVVMTAAQDARKSAEEIGAISFLEKPFDLADLARLLEATAREKRSWWTFWR